MAESVHAIPDVLVLGAGGTLGIAWLRGLVAGLETAADLDFRRCEYFVGTSAGSFVAAALAAGHRVSEPAGDPGPSPDASAGMPEDMASGPVRRLAGGGGRLASALTAPFVPLALSAARPGGAAVRAAALRAAPKPKGRPRGLRRALEQLGARFDGRLRVTAVDRRRGTRVVFGSPSAPTATVTDAVLASCSVPWMFEPVEIDGREYVDGGVWSLSNLDAAPAGRGSEVLAMLPTFGRTAGRGPLGILRAAGQAAGLAEMQALRARGARVRLLVPDAAAIDAMGPNLMSDGRRTSVFDAGFAQGIRLGG